MTEMCCAAASCRLWLMEGWPTRTRCGTKSVFCAPAAKLRWLANPSPLRERVRTASSVSAACMPKSVPAATLPSRVSGQIDSCAFLLFSCSFSCLSCPVFSDWLDCLLPVSKLSAVRGLRFYILAPILLVLLHNKSQAMYWLNTFNVKEVSERQKHLKS